MTVGQLFLESLGTGVITPAEIDWLLVSSDRLDRQEQAVVQRLGRLLDQGVIQLTAAAQRRSWPPPTRYRVHPLH